MALDPVDERHALQIQAGTLGRKAGHKFEDTITKRIISFAYPIDVVPLDSGHVFSGDPASLLLRYVASRVGLSRIKSATAISTGALATSEEGKKWLSINGSNVSRCKSDLVITISSERGAPITVGVSTKQCNNGSPTNAQLYFTTATAFVKLLRKNGIEVSNRALNALREFCGDPGYRPTDNPARVRGPVDPRRFFWEEIDERGRKEWEHLFATRQDDISRLLLQKAYVDDRFVPDYVLHKTKRASSWKATEVAIYSIDELLTLSREYQGFATQPYSVKKGSHRDAPGVVHQAPRFGVIQMQRGGQKQHPEQLQFNLQSGYFYKL